MYLAMTLSIHEAETFAEGLDHPECVVYHPDGSLWAGGEAGQLYKISPTGKVDEVVSTGGFILGMALSPGCDWMAICDLKNKCLWKLNMISFQLTVFSTGVDGHALGIPNFPCFDLQENLYVSDSGAFRQVTGKILKYNRDGNGKVWSEGPYHFSNGIAIDKAGEFLYVVCTFAPSIERIRIEPDGTAGHREVYVTFDKIVPDGLAFDIEGNLLVSCYAPNRIFVITPNRSVRVLIEDWEAHALCNPTNIAFGGNNFNELYVANLGRWHISRIKLNTKGLPLMCHL
jgi:gluconolactonase